MQRNRWTLYCWALLGVGASSCTATNPNAIEHGTRWTVAEEHALRDAHARQTVRLPAPDEPLVLTPGSSGASEDEWRFVLAPYGWLLEINGNARVDDTVIDIDEDFSDLLKQISFVVEGRFEAWKGRWGAVADFTYARLDNDVELGPVEAETTTDIFLGVLAGMYRFVDQERAPNGAGGVKVDGIAGITITSLSAEVDVSGGPDEDGDQTWVDPVVGMRSRWFFSEHWGGSLEALIGGFDLFDGSELFTMYTALVGREVGDGNMLYFGWRSLYIDYENGSKIDDASLSIAGPIVGFEWGF